MKTIPGSKRHHYVDRVSTFLVSLALIAGMVSCDGSVQYSLTVSSNTGGSVTTPGEGSFTYNEGAVVNLVAEAEEGYYFVKWTGDVGTTADANTAETTIAVDGDYSIIANFVPDDVEPVWDWYDLDAIRNNVSANYLLMNDLDSTTAGYAELVSPTANHGLGWQPIGTSDAGFTATFNGQGYNMRDLYIYRPGGDRVGLFGYLGEGGCIKDIGVVSADVTGGFSVGGLVGENEGGTISDSYFIGSVIGDSNVGGLVGENDSGTISNSHFTGSVIGESFAGGLVGALAFGAVTDSCSNSDVTGDLLVGGLLGFSWHGTVTNCYSTGIVTGKWDNSAYIGGLVGVNSYSTVSNSYSSSIVSGEWCVGGLVGSNGDDFPGTVSYSYSTGSVTGDTCVGGLVGLNEEGSVIDSYSTGDVTGDQDVGGLVGSNLDNVSNSFWDIETSGQATSDGGTGKNTTEMLDITTYSAWNITAVANPGIRNPYYIWNIVNGVTYPFLSWQP